MNTERRLLVVIAHPDDESFGPGGTIAYYANQGVTVHVVCATRGEFGSNALARSEIFPQQVRSPHLAKSVRDDAFALKSLATASSTDNRKLHDIREQELLNASKKLGVAQVDFLDFIDGTLNNQQYHLVAEKLQEKIAAFNPQVLMTFEPRGVSGHLDHIAISFITTYVYLRKTPQVQKLYYFCEFKGITERYKDYFIYFPEGYDDDEVTTRIDVSSVWGQRIAAMKEHKSQWNDVQRILANEHDHDKKDRYILHHARVETKLPETDLFAGVSS